MHWIVTTTLGLFYHLLYVFAIIPSVTVSVAPSVIVICSEEEENPKVMISAYDLLLDTFMFSMLATLIRFYP